MIVVLLLSHKMALKQQNEATFFIPINLIAFHQGENNKVESKFIIHKLFYPIREAERQFEFLEKPWKSPLFQ